jgi:23S rRNA (cytidine1920-2'-O)/16S rRNA (cytidine1409-2'-O)-methyltransferase
MVLPAVHALSPPGADVIPLVKPQFEVGREHIGKGGIVRDADARLRAVDAAAAAAGECGFETLARTESPITGAKGNVEYLLHLRRR